jgi:hypothetical protein
MGIFGCQPDKHDDSQSRTMVVRTSAKQIVSQQAIVMAMLTTNTEIIDCGTVTPALRTSSEI